MRPLPRIAAALLVVLVTPSAVTPQMRASERAGVSQTVDGTVIAVEYSRPVARGRVLFGGEVHWGEVWTPGANQATVLELGRTVVLEEDTVPAGRWSVWLVVAEEGPWELVLDPRDSLFHTQRPEPTPEQIRMPVQTGTGDHVEVLTWSFPEIAADATTLLLAWGTTRVPLRISVEPSYTTVIAREDAAPYVGKWEMTMSPPPAPPAGPAPEGSAEATGRDERGADERPAGPPPAPFDIRYDAETEHLLVHTVFYSDEGPQETTMILLPRAEGIFGIGFADEEGRLFDTLEDVYIEFVLSEDGAPPGFAIRGSDDEVFGRGVRRP